MVDRIWIVTLTFELGYGIHWCYRHGNKIGYNYAKCLNGTQNSCQITLYGEKS